MRAVVYLCLLVVGTVVATGDDFARGLESYAKGNYEAAKQAFEASLAGEETAAGRHNLALALHQMGAPAESAWNLERALRLEPHNESYHFKLALLRQQLGLPAGEPDWTTMFSRSLSQNAWVLAGTLAFWTFVALLLLPRCAGRRRHLPEKAGLCLAGLCLALSTLALFLNKDLSKEGIVLTKQPTELRAAPASAAPESGLARPGERARVLESHQNYLKLRTEGGAEGWIVEDGFRYLIQ